jgi:hypothetical protein
MLCQRAVESVNKFGLKDSIFPKATTLLAWYRDFNEHDCKGFMEDGRGHQKRINWLERHALHGKLELWLSMEKDITVDKALAFLLKEAKKLREERGEDTTNIQLSRDSAHRYMHLVGATFDTAKANYYTDTHESEFNKHDRAHRYIPAKVKMMLRSSVWCSVKLKQLDSTGPALSFTRFAYGIGEQDAIPIRRHGDALGVYRTVLKEDAGEDDMVKICVDFLHDSVYIPHCQAMFEKYKRPGDYLFDVKMVDNHEEFIVPNELRHLIVCDYKHGTNCRCHLPCFFMGQDESCYAAFALPKKVWRLNNTTKMRKKTEGQGVMITLFLDPLNGVGFKMNEEQLAKVNTWRESNDKPLLLESPGLIFFQYGARREGYWTYEKFKEQVSDMLDCVNVLYPHTQVGFEVDQSSGHTKHKDDGLSVQCKGKSWGGKQGSMRDTIILDHTCLGPGVCTEEGIKLKVGDVQSMVFLLGQYPFYDLTATPHDRFLANGDHLTEKEIEKCVKKIEKARQAWKEGELPVDERIWVAGFLDKAKGLMQIAYERGLWVDGMVMAKSELEEKKIRLKGNEPPPPSMYVNSVLATCADFRQEKFALQELVEKDGHILLLGVKCHPEMAGVGVEYCFGMSKRYFRQHNDCIAKNLEINVRRSFGEDVLPLQRLWKFERRARQYMHMYREEDVNGTVDQITFEKLESKMKTMKKTHRNIMEIEREYLEQIELEEERGDNNDVDFI